MNRRRILIIDDELDLCLLLKNYFVKKGFDVCISHTITEGLDLAKTWDPDDVFLDHNLPDGTGWENAPQIYRDNDNNVRFFLISAYNPAAPEMPEEAEVVKIVKPISYRQLDPYF